MEDRQAVGCLIIASTVMNSGMLGAEPIMWSFLQDISENFLSYLEGRAYLTAEIACIQCLINPTTLELFTRREDRNITVVLHRIFIPCNTQHVNFLVAW